METAKELSIIYLPPSDLTPYEHNAKRHPDDQVEHIANSIREFGFRQPIVVDADNVVVIGHGLCWRRKSWASTPCPSSAPTT